MTEFLITFLLLVFLQSVRERTAADVILAFGASLLACVTALALGVSYTAAGPVAAFAMWCLGERRSYAAECAAVTLPVLAATLYPWELFGAIPLILYSGKKPKRKNKGVCFSFFYSFKRRKKKEKRELSSQTKKREKKRRKAVAFLICLHCRIPL